MLILSGRVEMGAFPDTNLPATLLRRMLILMLLAGEKNFSLSSQVSKAGNGSRIVCTESESSSPCLKSPLCIWAPAFSSSYDHRAETLQETVEEIVAFSDKENPTKSQGHLINCFKLFHQIQVFLRQSVFIRPLTSVMWWVQLLNKHFHGFPGVGSSTSFADVPVKVQLWEKSSTPIVNSRKAGLWSCVHRCGGGGGQRKSRAMLRF